MGPQPSGELPKPAEPSIKDVATPDNLLALQKKLGDRGFIAWTRYAYKKRVATLRSHAQAIHDAASNKKDELRAAAAESAKDISVRHCSRDDKRHERHQLHSLPTEPIRHAHWRYTALMIIILSAALADDTALRSASAVIPSQRRAAHKFTTA